MNISEGESKLTTSSCIVIDFLLESIFVHCLFQFASTKVQLFIRMPKSIDINPSSNPAMIVTKV